MTELEYHSGFGRLYWYELVYRGISGGCQPRGFVDKDLHFGRKEYGAVGYERPLTDYQVVNYEFKVLGHLNWEELHHE